ncbi:MAG: hypothetical protein AAGI72_05170 [Pseudomonadota bacterium]
MIRKTALLVAMFLWAGSVSAAVIYEEATDGDITDFSQAGPGGSTDLGTLQPLTTSTILGTINAGPITTMTSNVFDGTDEFDTFQFRTLGDFTVNFTYVSGNNDVFVDFDYSGIFQGFFVFQGGGGVEVQSSQTPATINDIFAAEGALPADLYSIGLVPGSNTGMIAYQIDIITGPASIVVSPTPPLFMPDPAQQGGTLFTPVIPVPVPAIGTLALLASGLGGLAAFGARRGRKCVACTPDVGPGSALVA